ncbi:micronuclear linker histone polyprotein-like [Haliotis asinina]|uniref:micronuclear linker histone polyprotein-like n=1 Tax=Haliotis asinina TaxID=109174 RepID=UPI0035327AA1
MRGKRLTRSNKAPNAVESGNKSSDWTGTHLSRRADETLNFVTTSTPAKQSTRTCNDTTLSDTDDEISLALRDTPTGLRMKGYFRDEFLSSQAADSQLDVRWDHTSPDAYKHLKRVQRKTGSRQDKDDLSDIVCRLAPAVGANGEEFETISSTPPLLCSWLQANKATSHNMPFEGQIFRGNHKFKRGVKKKKRSNVQKFDDVLSNLHQCLNRLDDEENERENQRSSKSSTDSEPFVPTIEDQNKNVLKSERRLSNLNPAHMIGESSLLPKDAAQALLDEEEDLWSDDELFEDNSFILQATQLPVEKIARFTPSLFAGKRKQISPVLDQPKNKTKRCDASPEWEKESSDVIPPTCATKSSNHGGKSTSGVSRLNQHGLSNNKHNPSGKTNVNENNNVVYSRQASCGFSTTVDKNNQGESTARKSTSPFRKHSSFSGYESKNTAAELGKSSSGSTRSKSPWRKTSSFSGRDASVSKPATCVSGAQTTSFQGQTLPWKSTQSASNVTNSCNRPSTLKTAGKILKEAVPPQNHLPAKGKVSPKTSYKRDNLDTSWSDEILRQLAEPDEILESQVNTVPVPKGVSDKSLGEYDDFFDSDCDFSINETITNEKTTTHSDDAKSLDNESAHTINPSKLAKGKSDSFPKQKLTNTDSTKQGASRHSPRNSSKLVPVSNGHLKNAPSSSTKTNVSSRNTAIASSQNSTQGRYSFRSTATKKPTSACVQNSTSSSNSLSKTKRPVVIPVSANVSSSKQVKSGSVNSSVSKPQTSQRSYAVADNKTTPTDDLLSTQTLLEDDSFLKDDALFESQIIAMLEEVEYEASQQPKLETNDDKISCSPDEIEQKRLAAIAKRKQKLKT